MMVSPIVVNEGFEVIDGQHRLEACEELNMPIEFIMRPGLGMDECISINTSSRNWTVEDYIEYYAKTGNQNYILLNDLRHKYSSVPKAIIFFALTHGQDGGYGANTVKSGKFLVSRPREEACALLDYIQGICEMRKNLKCKGDFSMLLSCISEIYFYKGIDRKSLYSRLSNMPEKLKPFNHDRDDCILKLNTFYNLNRRSEKTKLNLVVEHQNFIKSNQAKTR